MNKLSVQQRATAVAALVEGNSLRATTRLTGIHRSTVMHLLTRLGTACLGYHDKALQNLKCERVQCDEIWSFVGCKEQHLEPKKKRKGRGDCWTWTALDPDTKLMVCWRVGRRETSDATLFMEDLASRLAGRIQLTTDAYRAYLPAVENAFGSEVDYATATKVYDRPREEERIEARYSPQRVKEIIKSVKMGSPDPDYVTNNHVERQNLNIRMTNRRFTRLTNAFSKKLENHKYMLAVQFVHHNFCRIHQTLRCTPAMEAGIAKHVWSLKELVGLLDIADEKAA